MELKEFIKKALVDIVTAVEESENGLGRAMSVLNVSGNKVIEFEVAVTSEGTGKGSIGIKVLELIQLGEVGASYKNESISRIRFGVFISNVTKDETEKCRCQNY